LRYNRSVNPKNFQELQEQGYTIIPQMIDPTWLEELRAAVAERMTIEGENAGAEFRKEANSQRLANLVDKGEVFQRVIAHPTLLAAATAVLGPDHKLSSLNYRAAEPHSDSAQPLHCDMGLLADEKGFAVFNSIWMLDDFTPHNGPTRAVPGSHLSGQLPPASHPDETVILGRAGDVIMMNSHCWHGGTANHTDHPRRSLHGFFVRGDQPQQQYQQRLLSPETIARLNPELRRILALDDPRNDALSATGSGKSGFLR